MSLDVNQFLKPLNKIIDSEPGIRNIMVIDNINLKSIKVSNSNEISEIDKKVEEIVAMGRTLFYTSKKQGDNLNIGNLEIITNEYSDYRLFIAPFSQKGLICFFAICLWRKNRSRL